MLLKSLKETDGNVFMALANMLVRADGKITPEEKDLLKEYDTEVSYSTEKMESYKTVEDALADISDDDKVKRLVFFELVGLAWVDSEFCPEERDFMSELGSEFGIKDKDSELFEKYAVEALKLYEKIGGLING